MNILGVSCWYHDAAACLVRDGVILAAAQEERFSRRKHDQSFPTNALQYVLREGALDISQVDLVAYYEKPISKLDRIIETVLSEAPRGFEVFAEALPQWVRQKMWFPHELRRHTGYEGEVVYPEHHLSHAASAFYPSPFQAAAILTVDGVGEWTTTSVGRGEGASIEILEELRFPDSLGLLYSAATHYLGFRVNADEYKVMGLAPYGEPTYERLILDHLVDLSPDGSFTLNIEFFEFTRSLQMTGPAFEGLFGRPRRAPDAPLTKAHADIAASFQSVLNKVMLGIARHVHEVVGGDRLCMAGGVALNCTANTFVRDRGPFSQVWVQPAAGDAGGAVGAALAAVHLHVAMPRTGESLRSLADAYLGPSFDDRECRLALEDSGLPHVILTREELVKEVAARLANGDLVGWFQGRMEFGPRALGNRSILADPRTITSRHELNRRVKLREDFRPFAPSVPEELMGDFFRTDHPSPYMLFTAPVRGAQSPSAPWTLDGPDIAQSPIPGVTHVDGSARLHSVAKGQNALFWDLLMAFRQVTGCPVLLNTSFNGRDEPIVCTPADAVRAAVAVGLDSLAIGSFLATTRGR